MQDWSQLQSLLAVTLRLKNLCLSIDAKTTYCGAWGVLMSGKQHAAVQWSQAGKQAHRLCTHGEHHQGSDKPGVTCGCHVSKVYCSGWCPSCDK